MKMHNPPHPGLLVSEWMVGLGMTTAAFARHIKISPYKVNRIIKGRSRINSDIALRLNKALPTDAGMWLNMQLNHDLWVAGNSSNRPKIERIKK